MSESGRVFIKKFVGFSLVTWISFILSFMSAPISTRLFNPAVLGKINIFNTYTNLFGIFILMGLDQAYARFYHEVPNGRPLKYLFTFCFTICYSLIACFIILCLPFRTFLSDLLFNEKDNLLLYLFFVSVWCTATLRYLNLTYRMEQNIKLYTVQGVLMTLVSKLLYLTVGFWYPTSKAAIIVLTASHFTLALVFLFIQRSRFEPIRKWDKIFSNEIFKYAVPLIPVSILTWANTSVPQIVMQKTMSYHSIGIYTSAVALANIILIVQAGFNTFWLPYTYKNYKTQTTQFYTVHRYLLCVLTIISLVVVSGQDIIFLILGEKYRAAKEFFPFLILGPVCYIIAETTSMGIDISKKTYFNIYVFVVSVMVNVALCLLLRKPLGVAGIAISTSVAAITAMVLKTYFGEKFYKSVFSYKYMAFTVIVILLLSVTTLALYGKEIRYCIFGILLIMVVWFYKKEIKELNIVLRSFIKKS